MQILLEIAGAPCPARRRGAHLTKSPAAPRGLESIRGLIEQVTEKEQNDRDLSPLELSEVEFAGVRLRLRAPVRLTPVLGEDNPQFLSIEEPRLGLNVFAGTVNDLMDEVAEDLVVVWKQFALAGDGELSPKALELKHRLLAGVEEVTIAR